MPGVSWSRAMTVALAAALVSGCAHSPAPRGWLPTADAAGADAFGGWLVAEVGRGRDHRRIEGELIAVGTDSLLVFAADGVARVPRTAITRATVAGYDIAAGKLGTWTTLGTISTLSHGAWLLLSAPTWIIGGSIATSKASHAPLVTYPSRPWSDLARYARFPQGLPIGLDPATLRKKR